MQCLGIAEKTKQQCKIKFGLSDGYCKYHQAQNPNASVEQCHGIAVTTNERCKITFDLVNGYCKHHSKRRGQLGGQLSPITPSLKEHSGGGQLSPITPSPKKHSCGLSKETLQGISNDELLKIVRNLLQQTV